MSKRIVHPFPAGVGVSHRRRGGFSLVEILVAIAVILVLLGIGIYGYRSMEDSASRKQTMANLASAAGLLKEMNSTGSYSRIEGPNDPGQPPPFHVSGAVATNPGDVNVAKTGRATVVGNSPRLMTILRSNPKIASMITALPSQALLSADPGQPPRTVPVLCDAWNNPLLLVPSGGLQGVSVGGSTVTVTSSGQANSPANRAFWASAGPDGNFSTGDDNLYSFQQ